MFEVEIARGLALLTNEQLNQIDLDRLSMTSCSRCVLGQLFGDFDNAEARMALDVREANEVWEGHWGRARYFGFSLPQDEDLTDEESLTRWDILDKEWKAAIRTRRGH
jgi:hypothetical protein